MNRVPSLSLLILGSLSLIVAGGCATSKTQSGAGKSRKSRGAIMESCEQSSERTELLTLGWDPSMVARFEARAREGVVAVSFTGCSLEVVDSCRGDFGAYDAVPPKGVFSSADAWPLRSDSSSLNFFPLGREKTRADLGLSDSATFSFKLTAGGSATGKRPAKVPLSKIAGCEKVTHFITGFSRGAAAVELTKGGEKKLGEHQGSLQACASAPDQGCQEPVRVLLTRVAERDAQDEAAEKQLLDAATLKEKAGDGPGCLADLDARARLAPENVVTSRVRALCLMRAGDCDKGTALIAAVDKEIGGAEVTEAAAMASAKDTANRLCTSASARTPEDRVERLLREGQEQAKKGDGKACVANFVALEEAIAKLPPPATETPDPLGSFRGRDLFLCAATLSCDESYALYKRYMLRGLNPRGAKRQLTLDGDKRTRPRFDEALKSNNTTCK